MLDFLNQFAKQKLQIQAVTELEKANQTKTPPNQTLCSSPNSETLKKLAEIEHVVPVVSWKTITSAADINVNNKQHLGPKS